MSRQLDVHGLTLTLPEAWYDATEELGCDVLTLVSDQVDGVLQISQALYRSGDEPDISSQVLGQMLIDFARTRELGEIAQASSEESDQRLVASGVCREGEIETRLWYVSDGRNIALVTLVCDQLDLSETETGEINSIVDSLRFLQGRNKVPRI